MPGKQIRRLLAMFLALASGCGFASIFSSIVQGSGASPAVVIGLFCVVGGLALHSKSVGVQILARGAIWSSAVFQLLILHLMSVNRLEGIGQNVLLATTVGCVMAASLSLYLAGRPDHSSSSEFQPVAHLGTLTVALILAVSDTLSLFFWGSMTAQDGTMDTAYTLIGGGILMGIGAFGLLRLRTWALLLNLCSNILIASVAALGLVDVGPLALVLITTAGVQLLVAMPILVSILRPEVRAPSWVQRIGQMLPTATLLAMAALALQPLLGESMLLQIAMWAGY